MSTILTLMRRLAAGLFTPRAEPVTPDTMSLHDWADLPAHHPVRDHAPC